jgi:hypothetical protein
MNGLVCFRCVEPTRTPRVEFTRRGKGPGYMEWLIKVFKALYEAYGTTHPKASLVVVALIGALIFGGIWVLAGIQVRKSRALSSGPPSVSGSASTSGAQSPAISGNSNNVTYEDSNNPKNKSESTAKKKR